jgi:hypothetical protein
MPPLAEPSGRRSPHEETAGKSDLMQCCVDTGRSSSRSAGEARGGQSSRPPRTIFSRIAASHRSQHPSSATSARQLIGISDSRKTARMCQNADSRSDGRLPSNCSRALAGANFSSLSCIAPRIHNEHRPRCRICEVMGTFVSTSTQCYMSTTPASASNPARVRSPR